MSISQKQIMQRAFRLANTLGTDGHASAIIDNRVAIEDLFPIALRAAFAELAKDVSQLASLKRTHTISITSGVGTLPDTVMNEYLDNSSAWTTANSDLVTYQERYLDFLRPTYPQYGAYTTKGSQFLFREPDADYGAFTGSVYLSDIPSTITDAIDVSTNVAELTIKHLTQMLKGAE